MPEPVDPNAQPQPPGQPPERPPVLPNVRGAAPPAPVTPPAAPPANGAAPAEGQTPQGDPPWLPDRLARAKEAAERETRAKLYKELGIEDFDKWKNERQVRDTEYETLKKEAEERRRAEMSEVERYKADIDSRDKTIAELNAKLEQQEQDRLVDQQDRAIKDVAVKYVLPRYVNWVHAEVLEHAKALGPAELAEFDDAAALDAFVQQLVKGAPEVAIKAAPKKVITRPAGAAPSPSSPKQPVDTTRPGTPQGGAKTAKPGQPNSMSREEFLAAKRARGIMTA